MNILSICEYLKNLKCLNEKYIISFLLLSFYSFMSLIHDAKYSFQLFFIHFSERFRHFQNIFLLKVVLHSFIYMLIFRLCYISRICYLWWKWNIEIPDMFELKFIFCSLKYELLEQYFTLEETDSTQSLILLWVKVYVGY